MAMYQNPSENPVTGKIARAMVKLRGMYGDDIKASTYHHRADGVVYISVYRTTGRLDELGRIVIGERVLWQGLVTA